MLHHLVNWILSSERAAIEERQAQRAALTLALTDGDAALLQARDVLLPEAERWVRDNLSSEAAPLFHRDQTRVSELPDGAFGITGPVDIAMKGKAPVRSWFMLSLTPSADVIYGDIVDFDPQAMSTKQS